MPLNQSAGPVRAQDDAGREKTETNRRQEKYDIARIQNSLFETVKMGHNAE